MKKSKIAAMITAMTMVVSSLAGCGGTENKQKLVFWMAPFAAADGEIADQPFWEEKVKKFEEDNNCEVSVSIIPWESYEEKYLTGTTSDDGPDVGYMYMEMFYDYIENKTISDINSYFTDSEKANYKYYNLGNIRGGQYALPIVVGNPRILIGNMDILKKAGIDKVPSNWKELEETCKAVKEKVADTAPLIQAWGSTHYGILNKEFWPYFWGAGADITDTEGKLTIDTPEGLEAVKFINDLRKKGYIPESATSNGDALATFKNGEAALFMCSSSEALSLESINWDFVPVLEGPKASKTFVAADSLVMFEKCKNKELAAKLMKYLTSKEVMSDFHKRVSDNPPITNDEPYSGNERFADLFAGENKSFQTLPVFKSASSMYDILYKNLQSMMLGSMKPEEVLTETTKYYEENLK